MGPVFQTMARGNLYQAGNPGAGRGKQEIVWAPVGSASQVLSKGPLMKAGGPIYIRIQGMS